jgi:hypothetical protein
MNDKSVAIQRLPEVEIEFESHAHYIYAPHSQIASQSSPNNPSTPMSSHDLYRRLSYNYSFQVNSGQIEMIR